MNIFNQKRKLKNTLKNIKNIFNQKRKLLLIKSMKNFLKCSLKDLGHGRNQASSFLEQNKTKDEDHYLLAKWRKNKRRRRR